MSVSHLKVKVGNELGIQPLGKQIYTHSAPCEMIFKNHPLGQ